MIVKKRCFGCGRRNPNVPVTTRKLIFRHIEEEVTAPWCPKGPNSPEHPDGRCIPGDCLPFTPEERASDEIKGYWTKVLDELIDPGVLELVKECQSRGWLTLYSCDGHGGYGYISFYELEGAQAALNYFKTERFKEDAEYFKEPEERQHSLLGKQWFVDIPEWLLKGSEKQPRPEALFRRAWSKFLNGYWTKTMPTRPGRYPTAPIGINGRGDDIVIYVVDGVAHATSSWGGWWWSEPYPELPPTFYEEKTS